MVIVRRELRSSIYYDDDSKALACKLRTKSSGISGSLRIRVPTWRCWGGLSIVIGSSAETTPLCQAITCFFPPHRTYLPSATARNLNDILFSSGFDRSGVFSQS